MKHGSKSQITIHQGLKGRYPTAMGIAHGKIIIVHQDLKGRYPIAMGIAHGGKIARSQSLKGLYSIAIVMNNRMVKSLKKTYYHFGRHKKIGQTKASLVFLCLVFN